MKSNSSLYLLISGLAVFLLFTLPAGGQSFQRTIYHGPPAPDVVAADLNQDGKPDLLTPQTDEGGLGLIFLNRGDGTFPDGGSETISNIGFPATRVVAADFNGDGITDLVMESCSSGGLTIFLLVGDGTGAFQAIGGADRHFPPFASSCTDAMAAITIANDTLPSIVVSSLDTSLTIFRNDGTGRFSQQQDVFGAPGMILSGSSVGDFNGDHLQDIAAVSTDPDGATRHIVVFYQNPDGTFQPGVNVFSTDATLQMTQVVDLHGNGGNDLLVPFLREPNQRAGVVALTNLGNGRFRPTMLFAGPLYTSAGQKATVIQSQDGGIRGILAPFSPAPSTGDPVIAFFPAENETWGKPVYFDIPNGTGAQAVVSADFNGDGRPDFAAVDNNSELLVFLNAATDQNCAQCVEPHR